MEPTTYLTWNEDQSKKIEEILIDLGYELNDRGKYWQCKAVYRNGDNRTALQIWKNTGIWKDFVANTTYQPFSKLVQLSCSDDAKIHEINQSFIDNNGSFISIAKAPKMEVEQFFSHEEVKTLVPHYDFYNKKGISNTTLKLYNSGFSMSGKMNGRFVFPIYDENGKVIGLSGRHLLWKPDSLFPKWKHLGRKGNWIYPINIPNLGVNVFSDKIEKEKEIILVEGIGDSLALSEQGLYNHMVVFGLEISSKQISRLLSFNVDKIIVSTNNDLDKASNRGLFAAIKIYLKLIKYFDISKVEIRLPICKDFGEMLENGISIDAWKHKKVCRKKQINYIINNIDEKHSKQKELLNNYLEELNFEGNTVGK